MSDIITKKGLETGTCKLLRRKCQPDCIFAPYFPPEDPQRFANVHRIFGASNVSKLLNAIEPSQRLDAVNSLAYEAEARTKDPVHGCVAAICALQRQVLRLQKELDDANADLMRCASGMGFVNQTAYTHQERVSDGVCQTYGTPPPLPAGDRLLVYSEVVDVD